MKHILYLLLLFIASGQTLFAQEKQTELLDIHLLEFPLPLGPEWYQAQKDAWKSEVKKNKKSENAWENYWFASYGESFWEQDTLRKKELQKEQRTIIKKMKKHIPNTRTYYRLLMNQMPDKKQQSVIQQKIISLKRTCERDYLTDLTYCHQAKQTDRIKDIAKEWYDSGLYSSNFLFYFYNEFAGLKKDAVLVSDTNPGTYYRYLLQYGLGLFEDVEVVDIIDLLFPNPESELWKKLGVDVATLPDRKDVKCPGLWYFAEKEQRPVYFTQFFTNTHLFAELKDVLYSEGLVFRYSSKPYNNMAATRKNYEQNYLLDYLRQPLIEDTSFLSNTANILRNYIVSLSPLLQFYKVSGDKNQYIRLKNLLQGILDNSTTPRKTGNALTLRYYKLMDEVFAYMEEMNRSGKGSYTKRDMKKEYQKLIDGTDNEAIQFFDIH